MKVQDERVGFGRLVVLGHEEAVRNRHAAELKDSPLEALEVGGRGGRRLHGTRGICAAGGGKSTEQRPRQKVVSSTSHDLESR
jgi:hypothetical protein